MKLPILMYTGSELLDSKGGGQLDWPDLFQRLKTSRIHYQLFLLEWLEESLHTLHNKRGGYIRINIYTNIQSTANANTSSIPAHLPVSNGYANSNGLLFGLSINLSCQCSRRLLADPLHALLN